MKRLLISCLVIASFLIVLRFLPRLDPGEIVVFAVCYLSCICVGGTILRG